MSQRGETESSQAANQRLKALAEIGRMVSDGLDSQAVLESAAEAAVYLLDGDVARIWLSDPGVRVLRPAAEAARAPRVAASLPVDDSLAGLARRSGVH
ncbi:MAG: hypothetical protein IT307_16925 [Chloroflexi bacterium]|nr:hypothetical protein [Chloroflexota bacterium]